MDIELIENIFTCVAIIGLCILLVAQFLKNPQINLISGAKLGYSYFLGGPILITLLFGTVLQPDLYIDPITLQNDGDVFALILFVGLGIALIPTPKPSINVSHIRRKDAPRLRKGFRARSGFFAYLGVYIVLAMLTFVGSGKLDGGHWYSSNAKQYQESVVAVIYGNFYNVMRIALPGVLLLALRRELIGPKLFLLLLVTEGLIELIISGNRIILLIAIFSALIAFKKHWRRTALICVVILPVILQINYVIPVMRGLMWSAGANTAQMKDSLDQARAANDSAVRDKIALQLGSATEATNLNMVKFIMGYYPRKSDFLLGNTFVLRSVLFFIPKAIWKDKPDPYSVTLGQITNSGVDNLALNSTYVGEAFANFGWLSVLILPMSIWIVSVLARSFHTEFSNYVLMFVGFAGWRFDFAFLIIALFFLVIVRSLSLFRRRSSTHELRAPSNESSEVKGGGLL